MSTTTIRKSLIESFGDPSHVSVVTTEIGLPAVNEVQVKVLYSGFGGSDSTLR